MLSTEQMIQLVKSVQKSCDDWIATVKVLGNQNAMTDRFIEQIIEEAKILKDNYEGQFTKEDK